MGMRTYVVGALKALVTLGFIVLFGSMLNAENTALVIGGALGEGAVAWFWMGRAVSALSHRNSSRLFMALLIVVAMWSSGCATRVNAGNVGISINYAGTYRGVQDVPVVTGWVFYMPFKSTVLEYPTFVQNVVWTHSPNEGSPENEEITFTNADQMSIAVDVSLAYHLDATKIPAFYLKFRNDDLRAFTLGFMRNVARDQFNASAGLYHMDQIMGDNGAFIADVRGKLQADLGQYGVVIDQFGIIGSPRPPQSVLASITAKVQAQQIAIQKENELAQSRADANKGVAAAEGYAREVAIRGEAESAYNRKLSASLTPEMLQSRWIDKWDGRLPTYTGGTAPLMQLPSMK